MAMNLGSLIVGAAGARAKMLEGQRVGEQTRQARERTQAQDLFGEWAKRRQLAQEDAKTQELGSYRQGLLDVRGQQADAAREAAAQKQQLAELIATQGSWNQRAMNDTGGRYDRQFDAQRDMNTETVQGRDVNNRRDNSTRVIIEDRRQSGAGERDENNRPFVDPNGNYHYVPVGQQPQAGWKPVATSGSGSGSGSGKPLEVAERSQLNTIGKMYNTAKDTQRAIQAAMDKGVGFAGPIDKTAARLWGTLTQTSDPLRTEAQRLIQALMTPAARAEIGSAMTPTEVVRIDEYLPMLASSDEKKVQRAVDGITTMLEQAWKLRLDIAKRSGRDVSEFPGEPFTYDSGKKKYKENPY